MKISRAELGRVSRVSESAIRNWEAGTAVPQVDTLARVVAALAKGMADVVVIPDDQTYLSDLRILAGLTQPQLAAKVGCSTPTFSAMERGQRPLRPRVARRLAEELGLSEGYVYDAYKRTQERPPTIG